MELLHFIIVASMALLGLALPLDGAESPSNVTMASASEYMVPPGSPYTALDNRVQGHNTLYVRLGTKKQHVGGYLEQRLYDAIHHCLWNTCSVFDEKAGVIRCRQPPFNVCKRVGINNIHHVCTYDHTKVCMGAYFRVEVTRHNFPKGYPGIEYQLFEAISGAFMKQSMTGSGHYTLTMNGETYNWWNVGNFVGVYDDKTGAYMDVKFNFERRYDEGPFSCDDTKKPILDFIDSAVRPDQEKLAGTSYGTYISCDDTAGTQWALDENGQWPYIEEVEVGDLPEELHEKLH